MTPVTPGVVDQAIEAVVAAYRGMTVAAGYSQDVRLATRHVRNPRDLTTEQIVAVMVARSPTTTSPIVYMGSETYKQLVRLEVMAYLRGDGQSPDDFGLASAAEALLSDLKRMQMSDVHFGVEGLIRDSLILNDFNDAGWEDDGAMVSMGLELAVVWNAFAPP